jgi:hypothetical protein
MGMRYSPLKMAMVSPPIAMILRSTPSKAAIKIDDRLTVGVGGVDEIA